MTDPYTTLGVSKDASAEEIKKAYRKLAHQHHPDKKGGDEAKFKEINEAYQILSDPDKKARYDRFGDTGAGGMGGNPFGGQYQNFDFSQFGGFGDIFDLFGRGGFGQGERRRPAKGEDIHLEATVTKKDLGSRKVYEFEAFAACKACEASGVAAGSRMVACTKCGGSGQVRQTMRTPFGTFAQVGVCPDCEGEGNVPEKLCTTCGGTGRTKSRKTIEIHLTKSLEDRYLVVFPQEGNAGPNGVPAGDLLLTLKVR